MKTKIKNNIKSLTNQELERYNRHILLEEIDTHGQSELLEKHVCLIGIGGLGCPIAYYLTSSGIGELTIIDHDRIDTTNLQRQILFNSLDVNKKKVEVAFEKLTKLNPTIKINKVDKQINNHTNNVIFKNCDLIIDATDNFKTRTIINKISVDNKKPLIMGSAAKMEGQVAVFRNDLPNTPCYNCLYNDLDDENKSCLDQGVLSSLTGIIGSIQATEAIKLLLNFGETLESKLLLIDVKYSNYRIVNLKQDKKCKICS
jgi:adenylyltransferase/sulfurtransferase|tara:strand:+ start:768 stop:1541 length:774 start_codon:yes stop_codon:yes gene_type:complete